MASTGSLSTEELTPQRRAWLGTMPTLVQDNDHKLTPAQISLGEALFYDAALSVDGTTSCQSCHRLQAYGVDGKPVGERGTRKAQHNTPTLYNWADTYRGFPSADYARSAEIAAGQALFDLDQMALPSEAALLSKVAPHAAEFQKAFPGEQLSLDLVQRALGAFLRTLMTPARWDKYVAGDTAALSSKEKQGFNKFFELRCEVCHNGTYFGGRQHQKMSKLDSFPNARKIGRFDYRITDADRADPAQPVYRVPSLRNVAKTAPYLQDGSVATLEEMVALMAESQRGITLRKDEIDAIVAWMQTLTGELPKDLLARHR